MCIKNHTHCSVESVAERRPQPLHCRQSVNRSAGFRSPRHRTRLPRVSEDRGTPFRDGLEDCSDTTTAQHIIYNTKKGCLQPAVLRKLLSTTHPGAALPLPLPPKKKDQQPPQTRLPPLCRHQCAAGIDPIGSPHPRIQCSGPLQKDPHPEPASGRALTPSRTRFSSPLAIARETATGFVPTTFPEGTQPRRVPAQWARTSVYWPQSGA